MKVNNAAILPKIYYGLHMVPGVAEYRDPGSEPYRLMLEEETIKNMDPTFAGRPVYVDHVDKVDMDNLQVEADGYVVESFYNPTDGKHWCKFIVVSDKGHEAIRKGWSLSNSYIPKELRGGGLWHGVEYAKEVTRAEYEHLAIVQNPRYQESKILTPEEFKEYNGQKEIELKRLTNSNEGEKNMGLSFFKKSKVENTLDLEGTVVKLPKSGKEYTIAQLANAQDEMEKKAMEPQMANSEHGVMVGEAKMSVGDLVKKHMDCMNELEEMKKKHSSSDEGEKKENEEGAEEKKENEDMPGDKKENMEMDEKKENMDDEEAKKKALELAKHEEDEMSGKKKNSKTNFEALKNAHLESTTSRRIEIGIDKVARGKARYGSQN